MSRVLVVGLDGATFDIIHPLVARGRLPNLAAMLREGAWGPLRSTIPPVSPTAWTSFFTGKAPGRHGIYGFGEIDPGTYRFTAVRTDLHAEKTLWQLLGEAGLPSIVWDVPFTYPPRPLDGWMLTGYGTSGSPFTFPADLRDQVPPELQPEVRVALPRARFDRNQRFLDEWREIMDGRRRLLRWLIRERPWSLFLLVFSITDTMSHVFWTYVDPAHPNYRKPEGAAFREGLFRGYEMCDEILGELVDAAGRETVTIVISDHGFGSVRPPQYIHHRLIRGGWVRPAGRFPLFGGLRTLATDLYLRFPSLREWVKGLSPERRRAVQQGARRAGLIPHEGIDPSRSKVLSTHFGLRIWVNDSARFARGRVAPGEIEATLQELEAYLLADRDPVSGTPVLAAVHRGSDLYSGESSSLPPDLIIEYANSFDPSAASRGNNPFIEGGHTLEGILLATGPAIGRGEVAGASLIDVAPTILHLLGQAVPPDMDGTVLEKMFSERFAGSHPVRRGTRPARSTDSRPGRALRAEEEAALLDQLRRLGYM